MRHRYGRAGACGALVATLCLAGCISLLPKQKPAQMYRFGASPMIVTTPSDSTARVTVRAAPTSFARAAAGDRILTTSGDQTAYIAGARWVVAASALFDDAVARAFEAGGGPARLLARDEPASADYVLKLDVQSFEVRYEHGRNSPPTIVVRVYAALVGRQSNTSDVSRLFQAETPAGSDSIHAIAAAFDGAVDRVLADLVAWVEGKATVPDKARTEAKAAG